MEIRHAKAVPPDQAAVLRHIALRGSDVYRGRGTTVAITSGKGGVGKTNIAVNLALCLAGAGRRVTLVDLDTGLANADLLLDVQPARTLADVLHGHYTVDQIAVDIPGGVRFVPGSSGNAALANISPRQRAAIARQLRGLSLDADFVILDCGAGISRSVLTFASLSDVVTVVSTPEPTSLTDAYAVIKLLARRKFHGPIRLLVNIAQDRAEAREVFARLARVAERFLNFRLADGGYVLQDSHVGLAVRGRTPVVLKYPRCPSSLCVSAFAARLLRATARPSVVVQRGGWVGRVAELFV